ncbi:hypothetical protein AAMO2058_000475300 [Amorphochlora amoebiformis]
MLCPWCVVASLMAQLKSKKEQLQRIMAKLMSLRNQFDKGWTSRDRNMPLPPNFFWNFLFFFSILQKI